MSIPSNLLPLNSSIVSNATNIAGQYTGQLSNITNQVSNITNLTTQISDDIVQRSQLLDSIIPDSVFSGSIEEIRTRANNIVEVYINGIKIPQIPDIASLIPEIPVIPRIPSYGEIKQYIDARIESIKLKRVRAFEVAQEQLVRESLTPYTLMKKTASKNQISQMINNVFPKNR